MSFKSISNITKKLPSLAILIASIVLNDSFRVENNIYYIWELSMRSGESIDSETMIIRSS